MATDELRACWFPAVPDDPTPRRQRVDRLLRQALAPLLGLSPDALVFGREAKGRPFLRHPGAPDFNLSDTTGGSLVAVCARGRVGVDLEQLQRRPPVARLAARYFSAAEASSLAAMDEQAARQSFLYLWTAKEASCKATGTGIFGFLAQWQFDARSVPPILRSAPADAGEPSRWQFLRLSPSPLHTAVIALRDGAGPRLTAYRISA